VFAEHAELTDGDVAKLVRVVRDRVRRCLRRLGKWVDEADAADGGDASDGGELLPELAAAAVQWRAALGERAGHRDARVGRDGRSEPFALVKAPLCAECHGFSLHAAVVVAARDRERLEKLCRYAARPAVAESRLVEFADGRIGYVLKKRWRDGTTHVVMTKQVLMERLCALVPRPRRHLVTCHGVLAPAAGLRSRVVPRAANAGDSDGCGPAGRAVAGEAGGGSEVEELAGIDGAAVRELLRRRVRVPHAPGERRRGRRRRYSWAELLARVFSIDVWLCPHYGGRRRRLTAIVGGEPGSGGDRQGARGDGALGGGAGAGRGAVAAQGGRDRVLGVVKWGSGRGSAGARDGVQAAVCAGGGEAGGMPGRGGARRGR
jgi:hypothetical protein